MQESSFILAVSATASHSLDTRRAIDQIAELAAAIPGVASVEFAGLDVEAGNPASEGVATASADIRARGRKFGEVRIRFDLRRTPLKQPVQLARFIGQQVALLAARAEDEAFYAQRRREIAQYRDELQRRKVVQRARGILARDHGVSQSRNGPGRWEDHTGRPLRHIAEAIVTASRLAVAPLPQLRRSA